MDLQAKLFESVPEKEREREKKKKKRNRERETCCCCGAVKYGMGGGIAPGTGGVTGEAV